MRYLLDTCAFIWLCDNPAALSSRVLEICEDSRNEIFLSIASIWEMQIKTLLGKLELKTDLATAVELQKNLNQFKILGIEEAHVYGLTNLPSIHNDPFDRILVSQARTLEIPILTCDEKVSRYPVTVIW